MTKPPQKPTQDPSKLAEENQILGDVNEMQRGEIERLKQNEIELNKELSRKSFTPWLVGAGIFGLGVGTMIRLSGNQPDVIVDVSEKEKTEEAPVVTPAVVEVASVKTENDQEEASVKVPSKFESDMDSIAGNTNIIRRNVTIRSEIKKNKKRGLPTTELQESLRILIDHSKFSEHYNPCFREELNEANEAKGWVFAHRDVVDPLLVEVCSTMDSCPDQNLFLKDFTEELQYAEATCNAVPEYLNSQNDYCTDAMPVLQKTPHYHGVYNFKEGFENESLCSNAASVVESIVHILHPEFEHGFHDQMDALKELADKVEKACDVSGE